MYTKDSYRDYFPKLHMDVCFIFLSDLAWPSKLCAVSEKMRDKVGQINKSPFVLLVVPILHTLSKASSTSNLQFAFSWEKQSGILITAWTLNETDMVSIYCKLAQDLR